MKLLVKRGTSVSLTLYAASNNAAPRWMRGGGFLVCFSDDPAESFTRRLLDAIPFRDFVGELATKFCQLRDAVVQRLKMTPRELEHVRAWMRARAGECQHFFDLVERESERLRFLDEPQFVEYFVAIAPIATSRSFPSADDGS
jgi:hypothetical protein